MVTKHGDKLVNCETGSETGSGTEIAEEGRE